MDITLLLGNTGQNNCLTRTPITVPNKPTRYIDAQFVYFHTKTEIGSEFKPFSQSPHGKIHDFSADH
jgi:hypothetical protein